MLHFLHIGKTGGSAIKHALGPIASAYDIVLHGHRTALKDVPRGAPVAFFVRNPLSRFVSGFNSRLRKGQPRLLIEWSAEETRAFRLFPNPNALAEAIGTPEADQAMRDIRHVNQPLSSWFESIAQIESHGPVFVGRQKQLATDFARMKRRFGLPDVALPDDPAAAHSTPDRLDQSLSPRARRKLRAWYAADIALLDELASRRIGR